MKRFRILPWLWVLGLVLTVGRVQAGGSATAVAPKASAQSLAERAFVDTLERRTFFFFWDLADPNTGLMHDRWPTRSFISVGSTGFALTAYPIGAERRWVTREQAATRTLRTLEFLWNAKQDT
ncbi:MAG: Tat pathway signal protein, partial [Candidatus Eisenbacteria bacterium]|nr:Tat pathway signal protein [Candidatus Eisenbacteria bacterium]